MFFHHIDSTWHQSSWLTWTFELHSWSFCTLEKPADKRSLSLGANNYLPSPSFRIFWIVEHTRTFSCIILVRKCFCFCVGDPINEIRLLSLYFKLTCEFCLTIWLRANSLTCSARTSRVFGGMIILSCSWKTGRETNKVMQTVVIVAKQMTILADCTKFVDEENIIGSI